MMLHRKMMSIFAVFFVVSLCACGSADKPLSNLDTALRTYNTWRTINVTSSQGSSNSKIVNVRSDGEYRSLLSALQGVTPSEYPKLAKWGNANYETAPSPVYWALANLASRSGQPISETYKWLMLGQVTGRYDFSRCKDQSSQGAYIELIMLNRELVKDTQNHQKEYLDSWGQTINWLKLHPYKASPMWICSHGMSAFNTSAPSKTYDDLVLKPSEQKETWAQYLDKGEKVLMEYRSGKRNPNK